jgi:hypothetical protein
MRQKVRCAVSGVPDLVMVLKSAHDRCIVLKYDKKASVIPVPFYF